MLEFVDILEIANGYETPNEFFYKELDIIAYYCDN